MKHIGSTLTIILGILALGAGANNIAKGLDGVAYFNSGMQMILGGIAYRWAKKRKSGDIPNTSLRKISEGVLMFFVASITIFRNDLAFAIASDPFPNVIIPAWIFVAYLIVVIKKGTD
jgi:hypothetical protein